MVPLKAAFFLSLGFYMSLSLFDLFCFSVCVHLQHHPVHTCDYRWLQVSSMGWWSRLAPCSLPIVLDKWFYDLENINSEEWQHEPFTGKKAICYRYVPFAQMYIHIRTLYIIHDTSELSFTLYT